VLWILNLVPTKLRAELVGPRHSVAREVVAEDEAFSLGDQLVFVNLRKLILVTHDDLELFDEWFSLDLVCNLASFNSSTVLDEAGQVISKHFHVRGIGLANSSDDLLDLSHLGFVILLSIKPVGKLLEGFSATSLHGGVPDGVVVLSEVGNGFNNTRGSPRNISQVRVLVPEPSREGARIRSTDNHNSSLESTLSGRSGSLDLGYENSEILKGLL